MKYPETPLNPKLLSVMQKMKEIGLGPVDVTTADLSYARAELEKQYAYLNEEPFQVSKVQTLTMNFEDESINIRLYLPDTPYESSTFGIYLHGGGWTFGNEQTHDGIARAFCKSSQLPVASIGYTLAPSKKFPFQNRQIADTLEYLTQVFQEQFGLTQDSIKFIFIGDSAGANLALATYQDYLTDSIRSRMIGMILYYGVYSGDTNSESWKRIGDGRYGLSAKAMSWYWHQYLDKIEQIDLHQTSPLLSNEPSLPPMLLIVGNLDPLLDDTLMFAEKLKRLNIAHQVIVLEGYPHGFLRFCNQVDSVYDIIKESSLAMQQMAKGVFS
ncbi:alpha/beta hydrolase fold domain-containing protein [Polynucleobacter kasalickyi]|uniref:Acetyl esterase n=1 Tax=Polynucleobacter kasalickyi TaxID=1938817 RepID=A0A1W2BM45_9BURK|nr:alpha/beta hydrolase fold domain-containing protein [Polynucleobacter kasalickyi]SMC74029.1 acetyl esterase [Polynucleobacter kasalickyi]